MRKYNNLKYNYKDIKNAYKELGVSKGMVISLKADLKFLGPYDHVNQREVLAAHFKALSDLVDLTEGTIVVSTASLSLCNTKTVFDIDNTPSEMGVLTEFIRSFPGSVRSFHPFTSYTAIGKNARYICNDVSRHSYGVASPKERLLELNAQYLSIGKAPPEITTVIHHIEMLMGVPYRYVKEFVHPVIREGKVIKEPFYMNVRYNECETIRTLERKIYPYFFQSGYKINEKPLGRGLVYLFSMRDFYNSTVRLLTNDLYAFLEREPVVKPYRN